MVRSIKTVSFSCLLNQDILVLSTKPIFFLSATDTSYRKKMNTTETFLHVVLFPHLERNLTIVYSKNSDLWFSKGLSPNMTDLTKKFIKNVVDTQLSHLSNSSTTIDNSTDSSSLKQKNDLILQYLSIIYQRDERICIRCPLKSLTDSEPFEDDKAIVEGNQTKVAAGCQKAKKMRTWIPLL
jgi:hypothetical protein